MFELYCGFILLIIIFLALDLGIFHKKDHLLSIKQALFWTGIWIAMALVFNGIIYFIYEYNIEGINLREGLFMNGKEAFIKFLTGYLIEKSLSLDNIFIIAVIFAYFQIPDKHQHRILFWGILGAIVFRGIMIATGSFLITKFYWMVYVFGGFLVITAVKLFATQNSKPDISRNYMVRLAKKIAPVHQEASTQFFIKKDKKQYITLSFLALIVIESSDVVFAVDSIPAIFAITKDPFIVFTSNIFAILGLRSLYFALSAIMNKFQYLKVSLALVLGFVGIKMIISHHYILPTWISLLVIVCFLGGGIAGSVIKLKSTKPSR